MGGMETKTVVIPEIYYQTVVINYFDFLLDLTRDSAHGTPHERFVK